MLDFEIEDEDEDIYLADSASSYIIIEGKKHFS